MPLCTALKHPLSKLHRRAVVLALGGIRDRRAVIPLLNNLSSTYYVVRQATIKALAAYGEEVVDDLVEMVEDSEVPIGAIVREAFGQQNKRLRLRAVRALGEMKSAAAIKPLRELMREEDREMAEATQEALSKIGLAAWARYGAVAALGSIGSPRALPALIEALEDHSEYVRTEAARGLAKLGDASALEPLMEAMAVDEDERVRREAAVALRAPWVEVSRVTEAFRRALRDDSWEVRAVAARALGRIDDEGSVGPLLAVLEDPSYTVSTSASNALANLGALAIPRLLETAGPESPRMLPALHALAEVFSEHLDAKPAELAALAEDERRAALQAAAESFAG
jgi:HEAT repeat protein